MELRFHAILYSKLRNENSDAGHLKCSRGPQVPRPWCNGRKYHFCDWSLPRCQELESWQDCKSWWSANGNGL